MKRLKRLVALFIMAGLVTGLMSQPTGQPAEAAASNAAGTVGHTVKIGDDIPTYTVGASSSYRLSKGIDLPLSKATCRYKGISIGSHEIKKTPWHQWQLENGAGKQVDGFCLSLGLATSSADRYKVSSVGSYSSGAGGKDGAMGKVIYWYTGGKSTKKRWMFAQALIWSIVGDEYSEDELKSVISRMKSLTGYYDGVNLYNEIFRTDDTYVAEYALWDKVGGSGHQTLMTVDSQEVEIKPVYERRIMQYYQDMELHKVDEDGNPMKNVSFTVELSSDSQELYKMAALGSDKSVDASETEFDDPRITVTTDDKGYAGIRFYFKTSTERYYYYTDVKAQEEGFDWKAAMDQLDEEGLYYVTDSKGHATQTAANEAMHEDMETFLDDSEHTYTVKETATGNADVVINPAYDGEGKKITLLKKNICGFGYYIDSMRQWMWMSVGAAQGYADAPYDIGGGKNIVNNYKKATVEVVKIDGYSSDKKAHGDANLDGAEFQLYNDAACTQKATVYGADGKKKTAGVYTVKDGKFETDYLRSSKTYHLKEVKTPEGYILNKKVYELKVDGSKLDSVEYTKKAVRIEVDNEPIKGKIAIQKFYSDGKTGEIHPEVGAVFQVYLKDKGGEGRGTYDNCDEYERDTVTIDEKGYACTKDLYYGKYVIHQVSSGDKDTEKVKDEDAEIKEANRSEPYYFYMNNNLFKAYLRIIKKDGNTEKDVLKAGTTYQIYKVVDGKETLVTQEYSNGNKKVTVDKFITDETGQIMTFQPLESGTYRIYETDAATGYHISTPYIEAEINSNADNYVTETDKDGNIYSTVELTYINHEAYGNLFLNKTGEQLAGYKDGQFIWEEKQLKGVTFEIYADEAIETQDGQGANWFEKDDLVGTITTGEGAVFESECGGITGYDIDEEGIVSVNLPLGKYRVEEKKTLYGYILPDKEWKVEFTWENQDTEYVLNTTDATDEYGRLNVENQMAGTRIRLVKTDAQTKKGIAGAVFGIYTRDDIYDTDGEKIVEAGSQLGTVTTDKEGKAVCSTDLPLMSEGYERPDENGAASGGAVSGGGITEEETSHLNSGDYYLKEQEVPGSYFLDNETEYPVHLEYEDQEVKVVTTEVEAVNNQTSTVISKTSITNSEELPGCELQITDAVGSVIVSWISGDKDSIKLNEKLEEMGYCNVTAVLDEKGAVQINGLLHDTTYTLTETRPADGFVTADSILFQLVQGENGQTLTALVNGENMTLQTDNIVRMVDDTTKVEISKTDIAGSEEIPGCELEISDKDSGETVEAWTSEKEKHRIEQRLVAGKTYVLTEKRPADGYATAESIEFTILDTGEVQSVQMKDDTTKIRFEKKNEAGDRIGGARIKVYDSKGKKVAEFTTRKGKAVKLEGTLKAGETYTFKETEAPEGYEKAEPVRYKVRDTGKKQVVTMVDKKLGMIRTKTPTDFRSGSHSRTSPQTGYMALLAGLFSLILMGGGGCIFAWRRYFNGKN